jgi:hypothetical protein
VLERAGYIDEADLDANVLEVSEDENQVDIYEYESGNHRLSLVLIH